MKEVLQKPFCSWDKSVMVFCFQESSQPLSCKTEDFSKSSYEKPSNKQPTFQIHVDEPDGASTKKPQQVVEPTKRRSVAEDSPLMVNNAVARLRQPLATIDFPSAMDVSFGEFSACFKCHLLSLGLVRNCLTSSPQSNVII